MIIDFAYLPHNVYPDILEGKSTLLELYNYHRSYIADNKALFGNIVPCILQGTDRFYLYYIFLCLHIFYHILDLDLDTHRKKVQNNFQKFHDYKQRDHRKYFIAEKKIFQKIFITILNNIFYDKTLIFFISSSQDLKSDSFIYTFSAAIYLYQATDKMNRTLKKDQN